MRADLYLFKYGHSRSREAARKSIDEGLVKIDGKPVVKPSQDIDEAASHTVECLTGCKYVSRGGLKLEYALDSFGIDPSGLKCADIGASSGGFTDCLLSRGAARVYAIDSGHGQLAASLEADERVVSIEGYNARMLTPEVTEGPVELAVMDVSFISQTLILPGFPGILLPGANAVTLIKPQFEAGRQAVGKGGIVKKASDRKNAVLRVIAAAAACGLELRGLVKSPIEGGDGNIEYLAHFINKASGPLSYTEAAGMTDGFIF